MSTTKSERLFEEFCNRSRIRWRRIRTSAKRTPDYLVRTRRGRPFVLAEVKELHPDEAEKKALDEAAERGTVAALGGTPGARIRPLIRDANRQFKSFGKGRRPSVLVVVNFNRTKIHTDPYGIGTAMMGLDQVEVTVPADHSKSPVFGATRSGPGRYMTASANTSTSAVAVLREWLSGAWGLSVYHNRFAAVPLPPEVLTADEIRHLRIPADTVSSLGGWEETQ